MTSIASLVAAAAVAQAAAAPPEDPAVVPTGTPEDVQLWRALRDAANEATVSMGRIAQCSFRLQYGRYYETLDEAVKDGPEADRAEAIPLRAAIAKEAKAAEAALPERPGIRECQYVLRDLGLAMSSLSDPVAQKVAAEARKQARGCVKRLGPLAQTLRARADALEGALAAADPFVARRRASAPASAAKEAATPGGGAPAAAAPASTPAAPGSSNEAKP